MPMPKRRTGGKGKPGNSSVFPVGSIARLSIGDDDNGEGTGEDDGCVWKVTFMDIILFIPTPFQPQDPICI